MPTDKQIEAALKSLRENPLSWEHPDAIRTALSASGFTIMSREDVEAVRNELLDRASEAALAILINDTDSNPRMAAKVENAIRSLKSKEGKIDS